MTFATPAFLRFAGAVLLVAAAVPLGLNVWGAAAPLLALAATFFVGATLQGRRLRRSGGGGRRW